MVLECGALRPVVVHEERQSDCPLRSYSQSDVLLESRSTRFAARLLQVPAVKTFSDRRALSHHLSRTHSSHYV